jgi:hypothetical protein
MKYLDLSGSMEILTGIYDLAAFSTVLDPKTKQPIVIFCNNKEEPIVGVRFLSLEAVEEFADILGKRAWEQEHGER